MRRIKFSIRSVVLITTLLALMLTIGPQLVMRSSQQSTDAIATLCWLIAIGLAATSASVTYDITESLHSSLAAAGASVLALLYVAYLAVL